MRTSAHTTKRKHHLRCQIIGKSFLYQKVENMKKKIDCSLFLITHETVTTLTHLEKLIHNAVQGGVTAILLREKATSIREILEKAKKIKKLLSGASIPLIINDRVDVALACGADGVHVGQSDMPYAEVRHLMGPDAYVGLSVETIDQALQAEKYDVDYLKVTQIFPSLTKPVNRQAWQLEGLEKLRAISTKKLVAVGGITRYNVAEVVTSGADGIGVVSAICHQSDPVQAAATILDIVKQTKNNTKMVR